MTSYQARQIAAGLGRELVLGAYTILDKIGAGGMGQVFKAHHRRMDRIVAIKMLPSAMTKNPAALARFEREVRAAAKLRHPNIVAADDAAEANGVCFLVMEYVDGTDLSALVKKNGPVPLPQALDYTLQAARGLEFAHGQGVLHRDIKPANLLLDKKGGVKILDMGLARVDSQSPDELTRTELTGTGAIMGTIDFMSPEQAMNSKNVDHRTDIYSLGISLYYLLAGKCAYDGDSMMEKLLAHREQTIPSLRDIAPNIPARVQAVFDRMVAKSKEDRYATMSETAAAMEKCQAALMSQPSSAVANPSNLSATEESLVTLAIDHRPTRRPRWIVFTAAALLGIATIAGVIAWAKQRESPSAGTIAGNVTGTFGPPAVPTTQVGDIGLLSKAGVSVAPSDSTTAQAGPKRAWEETRIFRRG